MKKSDVEHVPDAIQRQALRTWNDGGLSLREQQIHALLGLAGETGELTDKLKKHYYKPGYEATQDAVKDELSDVLYYVAVLSHLWGFTFDDMTRHLEEKLSDGHGWKGNDEPVGLKTPIDFNRELTEEELSQEIGPIAVTTIKEVLNAFFPDVFTFDSQTISAERPEDGAENN